MFQREIKELTSIGKNNIYQISQIEWWLLKNQENYKCCKENNIKLNSCFDDIGCACGMNSQENKFTSLYENLSEATEFHRFEEYAKNELTLYKSIISDKSKIKEWLIKNEKIASEFLSTFLIYYLNYSEIERDNYHLLIFRSEEQNLDIFIQRTDFENLIEFKELFDELYYVKKFYPEGLKRIEEKINKLPKYLT
ncbi:hypothetical protein M0M57_13815 [Flavobacterium azooxidireducens]|uniref:Uncharacterized protein n=1 Tax=Flavobacterium azooxidireducens TaxID=1871076 RepID=A0ABY4KEF0_9FLAO|nr:hypothetical protein [Flavobacterium azooxidireducens]UPQ78690.1 hypothetical protein M0M57_13815 [Flavobacterium azooxidireducens]